MEITCTLEPYPEWSPLAHKMAARCPHGSTEHVVVSKPELLEMGVPGFRTAHTDQTGCRCEVGDVVVTGKPA